MGSTPLTATGRLGTFNGSDWYSFVVVGTQSINLDLSAAYGTPGMYLWNSTNALVASASASASITGDGWINEVLQPGTYYVDVASSSDTIYSLTASLGTPAVGSASTDNAGHTEAMARNIGTLTSTAQTITGAIGGSDLSDFYAFSVSATTSVDLTLAGLSASATLYLLNAAGQKLAYSYGSATSNASIIDTLGTLTAGTYFIDIEGTASAPTGYSLTVAANAAVPAAGTTLTAARALGVLTATTTSYTDAINAVTTQEYYSFTLNAISTLNATISGQVGSVTLTLENAAGTRVASASGSANNNASLIYNLAPLAAGVPYYLEVSSSTATPYTLSLNAPPISDSAGSSAATAKSLGTLTTNGISFSDYVGAVDPTDYYSFVLTSAQTVNFDLSAYSGDDQNYAHISLYNPANTLVFNNITAGPLQDALQTQLLQPGTYDIDVSNYGNTTNAPFTLSLTTGTPSVGSSSVQNAGSTLATARNIGSLATTPATYADWIGPGNSDDYYEFTLANTSILNLSVAGIATGTNVQLLLLNAAGQNITSASGNSTSPVSLLGEYAAGNYYVDLGLFAESSATVATGYSFSAKATPIVEATGNTLATARNIGTLTTPQSFSSYVGPVENDNYYEFELSAAASVSVDVATGLTNAIGVSLTDVSGNSLTTTYTGYTGDASLVQPLAAGTYYVHLNDTTTQLDYTINISATAIADSAGRTSTTADALGTLGTTVSSGTGSTTTSGGGSTTTSGGSGSTTTSGGSGTTTTSGGSGSTTTSGGSGTSTVSGGGTPTVDAGSAGGAFTVPAGTSEYVTSEGNSTIYATTGAPTISASAGNPVIFAGNSSLDFIGGSGAATVIGGTANNTVKGGSGSLVMFAVSTTVYTPGTGASTIIGGSGALTATLGAGGGEVFGGKGGGNSLAVAGGSAGNAALVGVGNNDVVTDSGAGSDILVAGAGAETLNAAGATGALDAFFGGSGAEYMAGGAGQSFFLSGSGNETLAGGAGLSEFVYLAGSTARIDTINNFNAGDLIGLFGYGSNTAANVYSSAVVTSSGTTLTLSDNTTIFLAGFTNLSQANVLSA